MGALRHCHARVLQYKLQSRISRAFHSSQEQQLFPRIMDLQDPQVQFWNIINGKLRASQHTHRGADPRNGQLLWPCPIASREDLNDAVTAARSAFDTWGKTDIKYRQRALLALADRLSDEKELISGIVSRETGKSVRSRQ